MKLVKFGIAGEILVFTVTTLRRWEETGELLPSRKSKGGTRYYDLDALVGMKDADRPTIGYARVSSHDQKEDLVRQADLRSAFCTARGWRHEIIQDLGSGMNYRKNGLNRLLELILRNQMRRLVLNHKDRLLRFGARASLSTG